MLALRGGILEGAALTGEQVAELATLPPLDQLRGQLVGAIVAPLTQLLALVSAPLRDLHGLVDARIKQLEEQGELVEPPAAEATAERTASRPRRTSPVPRQTSRQVPLRRKPTTKQRATRSSATR